MTAAQSPAAGQNPEYAASIERLRRRAKKLCLAVVAAALCATLIWLSMGAADCFRVMKLRQRPLFCAASELCESGGYFRGFGYSFDIQGSFEKGSVNRAKVEHATLYILGIEAAST